MARKRKRLLSNSSKGFASVVPFNLLVLFCVIAIITLSAIAVGSIFAKRSQPDIVSPTVQIITPKDWDTVSGVVPIEISASDDTGVAEVRIRTSGYAPVTLKTPPYKIDWDTTKLCDWAHTVNATAIDNAGNSTFSGSISVVSENIPADPSNPYYPHECPPDNIKPIIDMLCPTFGPNCLNSVQDGSQYPITFDAIDNGDIETMEIYVDDVLCGKFGSLPGGQTYRREGCQWMVPKTPGRSTHIIKGVATDYYKNSTTGTYTVEAK